MIVRSRLLLPVAAIALAFAFAVPAAFADDMSKDSMSKDTGMKKDSMSKDKMSKDNRQDVEGQHVQGQDVEGQYVEVITYRWDAPGSHSAARCVAFRRVLACGI